MASTFRLPRWFERAEEFLDEGLEELDDEELGARCPAARRGSRPATRSCWADPRDRARRSRCADSSVPRCSGGALAAFPADLGDFFRELGSGVRTTVSAASSPEAPRSPGWARGRGWPLEARRSRRSSCSAPCPRWRGSGRIGRWRAHLGSPGAAVVAAAVYVLSATMLWGFSEGRLSFWSCSRSSRSRGIGSTPRSPGGTGASVPVRRRAGRGVVDRRGVRPGDRPARRAVRAREPRRRPPTRSWVGAGRARRALGGVARVPRRDRGLGDAASSLTSEIGTTDPWSLLRLAPDRTRDMGRQRVLLPVAAIVCSAGSGNPQRGLASAAGGALGDPPRVGVGSGYCRRRSPTRPRGSRRPPWPKPLVAYGLSTFGKGLERQAFGARQLGVAVLAVVLSVGLAAQALQVTFAEWEVRPAGSPPLAGDRLERAGAVPDPVARRADGDRFPAPAGDPISLVEAGEAHRAVRSHRS